MKWKGPGIPEELLADDEHFFRWYSDFPVICLLIFDTYFRCLFLPLLEINLVHII